MAQWFRTPDAPLPPVLDDDYLTRLANHIGLTETRELLADGLLELTDRLDQLATMAQAEDIAGIASVCHDVAGSAGHLGLSRLSQAAVEVCRVCRMDTPPPATAILEDIFAARVLSLDAASRFCQPPSDDPAEPLAD